jgi:dipeptidyl aminopeptidase/acylaminoacyl peptidase
MKSILERCTIGCILLFLGSLQALSQNARPLQIDDLYAIRRISDPALSPDGKWIVYTVTSPDVKTNKSPSDLWIVPTAGGTPRQLTNHPSADRTAAWSPDGRSIAFVSTRSGKSQIWILGLDGGDPRQFTTLSTEATQPVWSPDGRWIAFVSEVFPEFSDRPFQESDALNRKKLDEMEHGPVKAKLFTKLLYRHWDAWVDGKRKHIFVQPVAGGDPRDLTPGDRDAVPTSTTFSIGIDFAFSPDSKEIAYTATPVPVHEEAWSTNHDIYAVPVGGGTLRQLTNNPAADCTPRYSPDGRYLAYRAQSTPGYEADRWQLLLRDRTNGTTRSLTANFDGHVGAFAWAADSKRLFFESEEKGNVPVFSVTTAGNDVKKIIESGTIRNIAPSPDGAKLYFTLTTAVRPAELFQAGSDGKGLTPVTTMNDDLFAGIDIPKPESVWFEGDGGAKIQAWIFKPPRFESAKKYPLVYMVHGGPQNAWLNAWSYRWNYALWAAQGYVIMAPNPRGSTGFGQKFVEEISRDWGGKVFVDLMKGLDYASQLSYVDSTQKAAAGASFGGYMMNWFQAMAGSRFRTIVTHDGVFNFESMYGTTEEVWFDEWDHGGPPWDNPADFRKFSPNVYAKNFRTPNLIIHSELDFRVPLSEGMQLFTALQRQGVPSKFLYFPDEGHLILKPGNSELWHKTVFGWLAQYLH